ncbi:class I SAM-dependent methyltransferase [candidate division BRC1 bacterium HGW-BRC1-1]|jgi:2-polyprenyl-6-hydroxyphenyl methylase/3-demethylubiquinone-9 3-methyltransferase|nr:MAG: class I SAM-dependent methyltransferase [candidate division BRC1 bacterium HGW-BRC1-1]
MSFNKETASTNFDKEVTAGERFQFGDNWRAFLDVLDDRRIQTAVDSVKGLLQVTTLEGRTLLDVGSGSGLFSLAARRLGARVVSMDFDPSSVGCTAELRRRYDGDSPADEWQVLQGSALDAEFMASLGQFDIVYSWGVLHHTGDMWRALATVEANVKSEGLFALAIYNDQGRTSENWRRTKERYCKGGPVTRRFLEATTWLQFWGLSSVADLVKRGDFFKSWNDAGRERGMSAWHDLVDWVGGLPFEVAKPEAIFEFFKTRGYNLERLITMGGGIGCNQFLFVKNRKA